MFVSRFTHNSPNLSLCFLNFISREELQPSDTCLATNTHTFFFACKRYIQDGTRHNHFLLPLVSDLFLTFPGFQRFGTLGAGYHGDFSFFNFFSTQHSGFGAEGFVTSFIIIHITPIYLFYCLLFTRRAVTLFHFAVFAWDGYRDGEI